MLNRICVLFFLLNTIVGFSQTHVGIKTVNVEGEKEIDQKQIELLASQLLSNILDEEKLEINLQLKEIIQNELTKEAAFSFKFDKVKSVSILTPPDSSFRIFNWQIAYSDGTHSYECGILKRNSDQTKEFYFLSETNRTDIDLEKFIANREEWVGALYYEIIEKKNRFQSYYTLLAWEGNDLLVNKKFIDVLWFNKAGEIQFGAPIFKSNTSTKNRVVFKFGGQNSMRLLSRPSINRILFDHLSPPSSTLEGVYEYYGSDLSYDAYDLEKWILDLHSRC